MSSDISEYKVTSEVCIFKIKVANQSYIFCQNKFYKNPIGL